MASLETRLEEVFLHNLEPFCMDMVWANIGESNEEPCILYGHPSNIKNPSLLFSELLELATHDISKDQESFMLTNRRDDAYRAVILKVAKEKAYSFQGLFTSTTGVTYKFHIDRKDMLFQNVRTGIVCQHPLDKKAKKITKYKYADVLNILSQATHPRDTDSEDECRLASHDSLPSDTFTFISDEPESKRNSSQEEHVSRFLPKFTVKTSGEVVHTDGGGAASDDQSRAVRFYEERLFHDESPTILIVALHTCKCEYFAKVLRDRKAKNQVIIITDKDDICKQFSYQNTHLMQRLYFEEKDRCMWTISPLVTKQLKTSASIKKHGPYALAELIIVCEGDEDYNLLTVLIEEMLNNLNGEKSLMKKVTNGILPEAKKVALAHMLSGTHILTIDGKYNLEKEGGQAMQLCESSVPFCVVVDADALFQIEGEEHLSSRVIACIRKDFSLEDRWDFDLTGTFELSKGGVEKRITWEESPVDKYLTNILNKATQDTMFKGHFNKLCKDPKRTLENKTRWIPNLGEGEDPLKASNIFSASEKFGRIFAWKRGDGTMSGALGMEKEKALKASSDTLRTIMNNAIEDEQTMAEIQRFNTFIESDVFKHYNEYRRQQVDQRTQQYDRSQTSATASTRSFHAVTVVSSKGDPVLEHQDIKAVVQKKTDEIIDTLEAKVEAKVKEVNFESALRATNSNPSGQDEYSTRTESEDHTAPPSSLSLPSDVPSAENTDEKRPIAVKSVVHPDSASGQRSDSEPSSSASGNIHGSPNSDMMPTSSKEQVSHIDSEETQNVDAIGCETPEDAPSLAKSNTIISVTTPFPN